VEEVEVTFNDDKTVSIHIKGHKGKTCKNITDLVAKVVGGEVINRTPTTEMFQTVKQEVRKQVQG
jgi:hypothetical protein